MVSRIEPTFGQLMHSITVLCAGELRQWAAAGALAGVVRSVEDAMRILGVLQ
jgi:hypothetical protein